MSVSNPQSQPPDPNQNIEQYDEIIAIFDSVNLRAKQREDILAWHHKQVSEARIDGAKAYNRVLTDNLGKPTYMDDTDGRHTVYKQLWVSEAVQKANQATIMLKQTPPTPNGDEQGASEKPQLGEQPSVSKSLTSAQSKPASVPVAITAKPVLKLVRAAVSNDAVSAKEAALEIAHEFELNGETDLALYIYAQYGLVRTFEVGDM